jgi:hypothetical protein
MLRPDDAVSMDLAGTFGEAGSPSLAVSLKNGGRQEMSLQTVSRNMPADIPMDLPKGMTKVEDANNLTRSELPGSSALSGGDMSGSGMSIPSSASMPGMGMPTFQ